MQSNPKAIIRYFNKIQSVTSTAEYFNIHRSTVYRWLKRAKTIRGTYSSHGLERKSTKPNTIYTSLTNQQKIDIEELRHSHGYNAAKLKVLLNLDVSVSTIHRFLVKKKLTTDYGNHRRPRFQNTVHMHARNVTGVGYLQMDVKVVTPQLSGLPWTCYEYGVIDIYSRYKEAVILNQLDQDGSIQALLEIIPNLPFKPVFLQTDNGLEFQNRFRQFVKGLGIKYHYIHKQSPNENAVIERSFRTDQEEFFFRLEHQPKDYDELRNLFAQYLHQYNNIRPHHGLDLKTPIQIINLSHMS